MEKNKLIGENVQIDAFSYPLYKANMICDYHDYLCVVDSKWLMRWWWD